MAKTKRLVLNGGHYVDLLEKDSPWAQEWLWTYNEATGMVYRIENGKTIYLYHELLKRNRYDAAGTTLADEALQTIFESVEEMDDLIDKWADIVSNSEGVGNELPDPVDIVATILSATLLIYFDWVKEEIIFEWERGGDDFTARAFDGTEKRHKTLGDWMHNEWSGLFDEKHNPDDYKARIQLVAKKTLYRLVDSQSEVAAEEVYDVYKRQGVSLDDLALMAVEVIQSYPLPK